MYAPPALSPCRCAGPRCRARRRIPPRTRLGPALQRHRALRRRRRTLARRASDPSRQTRPGCLNRPARLAALTVEVVSLLGTGPAGRGIAAAHAIALCTRFGARRAWTAGRIRRAVRGRAGSCRRCGPSAKPDTNWSNASRGNACGPRPGQRGRRRHGSREGPTVADLASLRGRPTLLTTYELEPSVRSQTSDGRLTT